MTDNRLLDLAKAQRRLSDLEEADRTRQLAIEAREAEKEQLRATIAQMERTEKETQLQADKRQNAEYVNASNRQGEVVQQVGEDLLAGQATIPQFIAAYELHCRLWDAQRRHVTEAGHRYAGHWATEKEVFAQFGNAMLPGVQVQLLITRATSPRDRRARQALVHIVLEDGPLRNPGAGFDPQRITDQEMRNRRRDLDIGFAPLIPGLS